MDKEKKMERMLPKVKKTVDLVYEYLIPHPDGCGMVAKDFGKIGARIVTSLVNRKILEKTNLGRGEYRYKWIATMAPTPTLYRSIALEIQAEAREYNERHRAKKSNEKSAEVQEAPVVDDPVVADDPAPVKSVAELLGSTPQPPVVSEEKEPKGILDEVKEMWARMKELGVTIENNQLVLTEVKVTKTVLA